MGVSHTQDMNGGLPGEFYVSLIRQLNSSYNVDSYTRLHCLTWLEFMSELNSSLPGSQTDTKDYLGHLHERPRAVTKCLASWEGDGSVISQTQLPKEKKKRRKIRLLPLASWKMFNPSIFILHILFPTTYAVYCCLLYLYSPLNTTQVIDSWEKPVWKDRRQTLK